MLRSGRGLVFGGSVLLTLIGIVLAQSGWAGDERLDEERIGQLIDALGSDSAAARDQAYAELLRLGPAARRRLERAQESTGNPLLLDHVQRLLEELDREPVRLRLKERFGSAPDQQADGRDDDDRLRRPRRGMPPIPRWRTFRSEELDEEGREELDRELERWHQEMDQWNEELDRLFEQLTGELDGPGWPGGLLTPERFGTGSMNSFRIDENGVHSYELKTDENGKVTARVESEKDGEKTEQDFEADSLEAFRDSYPEIAKEMGLDGQGRDPLRTFRPFRFQRDDERIPFGLEEDLFGSRRLERGGPAWPFQRRARSLPGRPSGQSLGVQVRVLAGDDPLRAHVALDPGIGLLVVEVVPGSLAERIDVRSNDILIQVGGQPVGEPVDVRAALEEADDLDRVEVTVLRQGRELLLGGDG